MNSKDKILLAARDLFYHNGYLATSVDDIIDRAGVSKSNFYYHFKSKEDLGLVVLEQRKADLQELIAQTLDHTALSPKERLICFFNLLVEIQEARSGKCGCPFGNLVAEMAEHSERLRCQLSAMFGGLTDQIARLVAEGQQKGEFRQDLDAHDLAALIVQTSQGMHLLTKCHKTIDTFGRSVRVLSHLIEAPKKHTLSGNFTD